MNILDRFLKNNNCYDDFMINLLRHNVYSSTDSMLEDDQWEAITSAFTWRLAPKRDEKYWNELSQRWRIYLDFYNDNHKETDLFEI